MIEKAVVVAGKTGLHARPAALLVKAAGGFDCTVELIKGEKAYNAKSILSIIGAGLRPGDAVVVRADGENETAALQAVAELIRSGFGENNAP